ncbi:MAG: Chorismate synthase [Candidatus Anoxychlamydiales bacterium]|nr:Chorismate synthase [Candidatus Anoxychlamydiales bacterium]NGX41068.1 Chorismate synthase [Candidatus Anoxychlamydiales bacterium]HEU64815.1 chorismate synthase [Chlamydiota bacterium]
MSNSFGKIFKITTFGESHGPLIGVVIDGCPSNIEITEDEINLELKKRRPNLNEFVSKRDEEDSAKIVSGVFDGKTTGAPICILIENRDVKSKNYDKIKDILRPSHANYTYLQKYKIFDHRGGSRASARETASRVAAGAIAKKILKNKGIQIFSYVKSIGDILADVKMDDFENIYKSKIFCPDKIAEKKMIEKLKNIQKEKDSIGGVVEFVILNVFDSLGDPIYDKLNAKLASALMSIPAAIGFEIGDGFDGSKKLGSIRNDLFDFENSKIVTKTNNEGGIQAGISNSMPIVGRVAFKPTPTIGKNQETIDIYGNKKKLKFSNDNRYDPCIAIRAVSVIEAMCSLVIVDSFLLHKTATLEHLLKKDESKIQKKHKLKKS